GALVTFVVGSVIAVTKFTHVAWAVVVVIALIVVMFRAINRHYRSVSAELSLAEAKPPKPLGHRVIIPVSGIHRGVLPALRYAKSLCGESDHGCINAVYDELNPQSTAELRGQWKKWGMDVPLKVIESPFRSITTPLINYIHAEAERND